MKKTLASITMMLTIAVMVVAQSSCSGKTQEPQPTEETSCQQKTTEVEILYMHGKQRCATCMAIEKQTQEMMTAELAQLADQGKVSLRVVDMTTDEGKELARKYRVSWSSLFLLDHTGAEDRGQNLTDFAFENALNHPDAYREELAKRVRSIIDN